MTSNGPDCQLQLGGRTQPTAPILVDMAVSLFVLAAHQLDSRSLLPALVSQPPRTAVGPEMNERVDVARDAVQYSHAPRL